MSANGKQKKNGNGKPKNGGTRYNDEQRREIMHTWAAENLSIKAVSERYGISWNTLDKWYKAKKPTDWDDYKAQIMAERNRIAIDKVAGDFAKSMEIQLDSSKQLGKVAMAVLGAVANKLRSMRGDDPNNPGEIVFDKSTTAMMREARHALESVQKQQLAVFGVPNIRIDMDTQTMTPWEMILSGKLVGDMDDGELTSMILSFMGSEEGGGDAV